MHPSQAENESEGFVNRTELIRLEATDGAAEPLWVNDRGLLDQHASGLTRQVYRRPKARHHRCGRGWCDERRTEMQKLIGLHDDRISRPALLASSCPTRRW